LELEDLVQNQAISSNYSQDFFPCCEGFKRENNTCGYGRKTRLYGEGVDSHIA